MKDLRYIVRNSENLVTFQIPRFNDEVSGVELLVQIVINHLLTTVGSDLLNPERGGSFLKISRSTGQRMQVPVKITHAINRIEQDIIAEQETQNIPEDEQLDSLEILGWDYDPATGRADLKLGINTVSGDFTEIKL